MSREQVYSITAKKLSKLLTMTVSGPQKAQLATLRRGAGKAPGELPELWGVLLEDIPEELLSQNGVPTYGEWSIYAAMTLFAVHQQGKDPKLEPMHRNGQTFGGAVAGLIQSKGDEERIIRRFNIAATATEPAELTHHLRGIVQLLREQDIALDYAALAADLYSYQFPESRARVRLRWGQDFYGTLNAKRKDDNNA